MSDVVTAERFAAMTLEERRNHLAQVSAVLRAALGGSGIDPEWKQKEAELLQAVLMRGGGKK